jgi:invasion protein IalB
MTFPPIKRAIILALIALLTLSFSGSRAADDPRASQLTFEPWSKWCIGSSRCFVGRGARGACGPSGGGVAVHILNGRATNLAVNFATRRKLEDDISVQVDQDQPIYIPVAACYPGGCHGELGIDDNFVERLKRASTITIEATTTVHQRLMLSFSLADFARAYDGLGTEPKVTEEIISSEKMKERAQQEEERRKALECKE